MCAAGSGNADLAALQELLWPGRLPAPLACWQRRGRESAPAPRGRVRYSRAALLALRPKETSRILVPAHVSPRALPAGEAPATCAHIALRGSAVPRDDAVQTSADAGRQRSPTWRNGDRQSDADVPTKLQQSHAASSPGVHAFYELWRSGQSDSAGAVDDPPLASRVCDWHAHGLGADGEYHVEQSDLSQPVPSESRAARVVEHCPLTVSASGDFRASLADSLSVGVDNDEKVASLMPDGSCPRPARALPCGHQGASSSPRNSGGDEGLGGVEAKEAPGNGVELRMETEDALSEKFNERSLTRPVSDFFMPEVHMQREAEETPLRASADVLRSTEASFAAESVPTDPSTCSLDAPHSVTTVDARMLADTCVEPLASHGEWHPSVRLVYSRAVVLSLRDKPESRRVPDSLRSEPLLQKRRAFKSTNDEQVPEADAVVVDAVGVRRSADVVPSGVGQSVTFEEMGLPYSLVAGLRDQGVFAPSPVQLRCIPLGRMGVDLIVSAKSGTGKTVVFCTMALEIFLTASSGRASCGPSTLVLCPTRDIAAQIRDVLTRLSAKMAPTPTVGLFIGGTSMKEDEEFIQRMSPAIAVGTPGRLDDLIKRGSLHVGELRLLVLDEADKLMERSFETSIAEICNRLPVAKQVAAFSATYSSAVLADLHKVMTSPEWVNVCDSQPLGTRDVRASEVVESASLTLLASSSVLRRVRHYVMWLPASSGGLERSGGQRKAEGVIKLFERQPFGQAIVFCNNRGKGLYLDGRLKSAGYQSVYISGYGRQKAREQAMESMRDGSARVLVSTDLTSRGIDLPACDLVVHLDVPASPATYLHRVGRAGRFGRAGVSVACVFRRGPEETAVAELAHCLGIGLVEYELDGRGESTDDRVDDSEERLVAQRPCSPDASPMGSALRTSTVVSHSTSRSDAEATCRVSEHSSRAGPVDLPHRDAGGAESFANHMESTFPASDARTSIARGNTLSASIARDSNCERSVAYEIGQSADKCSGAYEKGWRDGYEAAFRIARELRRRLQC